jgi:hypothetical protein
MEVEFGFGKQVNLDFDAAIDKVTADLQTEGFTRRSRIRQSRRYPTLACYCHVMYWFARTTKARLTSVSWIRRAFCHSLTIPLSNR